MLNLLIDLKDDLEPHLYLHLARPQRRALHLATASGDVSGRSRRDRAGGSALVRSRAHPYTRALLAAMPSLDPDKRTKRRRSRATRPTRSTRRPGCRFHTRCPFAEAVCSEKDPALFATGDDRAHRACHMVDPGSGHSQAAGKRGMTAHRRNEGPARALHRRAHRACAQRRRLRAEARRGARPARANPARARASRCARCCACCRRAAREHDRLDPRRRAGRARARRGRRWKTCAAASSR